MTPIKPGDRVYRVVTVYEDIDSPGELTVQERPVVFTGASLIVVSPAFSDHESSFHDYDLGSFVFASRAEALDAFRAEQERVIRSAESATAAARAALAWARSVA